MNILFYSKKHDEAGQRLLRVVKDAAGHNQVEICRNIVRLCNNLIRNNFNPASAVLLAADHDDLDYFIMIRSFLDNLSVTLVLPDMKEETVAKGHKLNPGVLTSIDSDFSEVSSALKNKKQAGFSSRI